MNEWIKIGKNWRLIMRRETLIDSATSGKSSVRRYKETMKFPTFTLTASINEIKHGDLFTGSGPYKTTSPGRIVEVLPSIRVRFEKAGFCVVNMNCENATAEDMALFEKEMKAAQAEGTFPPKPEGPAILSEDEMKIALATIGNLTPAQAEQWKAEQTQLANRKKKQDDLDARGRKAMERAIAQGRAIRSRAGALVEAYEAAGREKVNRERKMADALAAIVNALPRLKNAAHMTRQPAAGGEYDDLKRLLYRMDRKMDGLPPAIAKLKEQNRPLSKGAAALQKKLKLPPELWETYLAHWEDGKTQTQIAVDRGWPKTDAYKINRECAAIKKAFEDAGESIPEKLTRHNAEQDADGTIVKRKAKNPNSWV